MMVSIYIEGKKYIVEHSKNILEVCLSMGFDIPYFCWHPVLGSIGACRQCAVKVCSSNDSIGNLVMSCMTPVSDGIYISILDKDAQEFRKNILELLMINHPHDCPICEEGGNCHLQDMTVMIGQTYRRYNFSKRTHHNQYLGPLISHEMNRCITCYRCVRYYQDYAGGSDLGVFGVHDNIYFGRVNDGMLENEFSGNLIEICPTGVFTDKTQSQNYTRKWDVMFAPSICQQCSIGCNIIIGERYGKLCRVENRYNSDVNGYFLCDRGRFGCDYVNLTSKLTHSLERRNDSISSLSEEQVIKVAVNALRNTTNIIGIGSSRASIESNFALRQLVGSDNFYTGVNRLEQEQLLLILDILNNGDIHTPSLREIETYDAILILGEDITQTGARVALSIRQAIKKKSNKIATNQGIFDWQSIALKNSSQGACYPLLITGLDKTKLDDIATVTYYDSVQNQAKFGFAVAHELDNNFPIIEDFDYKLREKLDIVVNLLKFSNKPLIVSGSHSGSKELIVSAANIARALKSIGKNEVGITFVVDDVNSMGLTMMEQKSLDDALIRICSSSDDCSISLILLENDIYRYISSIRINKVLSKINYLIVLDHQKNLIQNQANLVLSVANFVNSDGTVVNYEGRAQRFFRLCNSQLYNNKNSTVLESWRWLYLIRDSYLNVVRKECLHIDDVIDSVINCFPQFTGIKDAAPDSLFRVHGKKIAQAPHRYSGQAVADVYSDTFEQYIPKNEETMFTFSMEGYHSIQSTNQQIPFIWMPGWNSPQAWNKFRNEIEEGGEFLCKNTGVCLFPYSFKTSYLDWFNIVPKLCKDIKYFNDKCNKLIVAPYWYLFGSGEMSQKSKCIQSCMKDPCVIMNLLDINRLNINKNTLLKFTCIDRFFCLPIQISSYLPIGHIGLPLGFPDFPIYLSGMYIKICKE